MNGHATDRSAGALSPVLDGRLYVLGGTVPIDGRVSWLPSGKGGFAPLSCYLLLAEEQALLVDTGVPAQERTVLDGLDTLVGAGRRLSVFLTRVVEFDSAGNAAAILRRFPVETVYSQFPPEEWIEYHPRLDALPVAAPAAWCPLGHVTRIAVGGREVEVITPPLRLLGTKWVYDPATKALLTSDSFGHAAMATADAPRVVDTESDTTTVDLVREQLLTKFDWLAGADTAPLRRALAEIFETRDIEVIAPGHGCALRGRSLVERHYEFVQQALAELGSRGGRRSRHRTRTPARQAVAPRELVPGVHWLGDCLALDHEGETLHSYHSAYLVEGSEASLLVDTGHPKDWATIESQLDALVAAGSPPISYVFPTHAEVPHAANLARLLAKFPEAVACGDMRDYHLFFPNFAARFVTTRAGEEIDLGGTSFVLAEAVIKDLVTSLWGYDSARRVLFPGDGFAYMHHHRAGECWLVAEELPELPIAEFTALFAEYALYWTRFSDMEPHLRALDALIEGKLPTEVIAPGHGAPILDPAKTVPAVKRGLRLCSAATPLVGQQPDSGEGHSSRPSFSAS